MQCHMPYSNTDSGDCNCIIIILPTYNGLLQIPFTCSAALVMDDINFISWMTEFHFTASATYLNTEFWKSDNLRTEYWKITFRCIHHDLGITGQGRHFCSHPNTPA